MKQFPKIENLIYLFPISAKRNYVLKNGNVLREAVGTVTRRKDERVA